MMLFIFFFLFLFFFQQYAKLFVVVIELLGWFHMRKIGDDVMNWENVRHYEKEHLVPIKIKEKMACWDSKCSFLSCKSLIVFLPVWPCFRTFSRPPHLMEGINWDIMKQFGSVATWPLKKEQRLPFAYSTWSSRGSLAITITIIVIIVFLTSILEYLVVGREHKKLHFRWGHAFSSSPLKRFLERGVEFFKGNSLRPWSGPWPYVVEWRLAQCRSVLGSVLWG